MSEDVSHRQLGSLIPGTVPSVPSQITNHTNFNFPADSCLLSHFKCRNSNWKDGSRSIYKCMACLSVDSTKTIKEGSLQYIRFPNISFLDEKFILIPLSSANLLTKVVRTTMK